MTFDTHKKIEEENFKLDLVQPCETQKISMNNPLFKNIPHVGSFWHLLIVNLYFYIRLFDSWECHFWYPWTILSSKIYNMLGLSGTLSYAVFVYLYFCICMFDSWKYHFWYPWTILFSKLDQGALGMSDPLKWSFWNTLLVSPSVHLKKVTNRPYWAQMGQYTSNRIKKNQSIICGKIVKNNHYYVKLWA